jgi:hypothetical protein
MQTCAVDLTGKVVDCCILTAIYFTPDHLISAERPFSMTYFPSSSLKLSEIPLTQCLSSVGVL